MTQDEQPRTTPLRYRLARTLAAVVAAVGLAVVGAGTLDPETAQAAGVVLDHRPWQQPG